MDFDERFQGPAAAGRLNDRDEPDPQPMCTAPMSCASTSSARPTAIRSVFRHFHPIAAATKTTNARMRTSVLKFMRQL